MKSFILSLKQFLENVIRDSRIPDFDKKVVATLLGVILFIMLIFISSNVPVGVQVVVFIIFSLVIEYFFETLDTSILLSHYPWTMKSFNRLQRIAHFFAFFAPNFIKFNLWKYKKDPFR
jgi:hypothetical protein